MSDNEPQEASRLPDAILLRRMRWAADNAYEYPISAALSVYTEWNTENDQDHLERMLETLGFVK